MLIREHSIRSKQKCSEINDRYQVCHQEEFASISYKKDYKMKSIREKAEKKSATLMAEKRHLIDDTACLKAQKSDASEMITRL